MGEEQNQQQFDDNLTLEELRRQLEEYYALLAQGGVDREYVEGQINRLLDMIDAFTNSAE